MTEHIFNYKIITKEYEQYKICRDNYWAHKSHGIHENINIRPKILENIKTTNEIRSIIFYQMKKI